jgi:hypothetical protein
VVGIISKRGKRPRPEKKPEWGVRVGMLQDIERVEKLSKLVAQFQQELTLTTSALLSPAAVTANLTFVEGLLAQTRALVVRLETEQENLAEGKGVAPNE